MKLEMMVCDFHGIYKIYNYGMTKTDKQMNFKEHRNATAVRLEKLILNVLFGDDGLVLRK